MVRSELAWAAGLYEGEGSIGCYTVGRDYPMLMASLQMTDLDVLEQFHSIVGIGHISGPVQRGGNRKPRWAWQTGKFEHSQQLVALLWPWLCTRRREQATKALLTFRGRH